MLRCRHVHTYSDTHTCTAPTHPLTYTFALSHPNIKVSEDDATTPKPTPAPVIVPQELTLTQVTQLLDMATVIAQMDDIEKVDAYSDFCEVLDEVSSSKKLNTFTTLVKPNRLFFTQFCVRMPKEIGIPTS